MAKDEEREVFACFGSAFLHANTFEISLAKVIVHFDYLKKILDAARRGEIATFNEETFFSDFDAFLEKLFAMTMGELIKRVNALTALDVQLAGRIKTALEKRNFLTHHFFREWAEISALPLGCQRMCIELENMEMLFKEVERDLRAAIFPVSRKPTGNAFVDSFNSAFDKAFKS